jgi:hypothetical protein
MPTKILGAKVGSDVAEIVILTKEDNGDFTLEDQTTMKLQKGERPSAYDIFHGQLSDFIKHQKVKTVCIKGSTVSMGGTKLAHLHAAELRGVVQAAAASAGTEVRIMTKAAASRNFGTRKVDEYLKDDTFWAGLNLTTLKKGLREAAFAVISEFPKP